MVVRIEMLGAGRMARMHAGRLAELPEARIVAIADPLSERAAQLSERTGATADADYRQMLDRERLDAVYICTPTGQHAEQAITVAERDVCHIRSSVGETLRSLAPTLAANDSARTWQTVNLDAFLETTRPF